MPQLTEAAIAVPKPSLTKGYAIALTATILWATTGILISYLLTNYAIVPLTLACWRDVIVSSVLAVILAAVKPSLLRIRRQDLPFFAVYGFLGVAVFNALWVYSVDFNGATLAVVLVYTGPAFVAVAAHWLFHEALTRLKILAVALSLVGCVLVTRAYDLTQLRLNPLGILCGVGVGVGFAFYSIFGKLSAPRYSPWTATAYSFGFGAFFLLLTQRPAYLVSMGNAPLGWLTLFILAAGPTLIGFALYMVSLGYLPVSVASLIATLEPVFTAIMAFFLLGERLNAVQSVGALLIIFGVISLRRDE
jgi:drug/metabolite transporter (DMT)-like permease